MNKTNECIEEIHQLRKELKKQEIDGFEFYFEKENILQELSHSEDKKQLFYELFINDNMAELSTDDKIVALTGITRYNIEKFSKKLFRNQNLILTEDKQGNKINLLENIKQYGNEIFEKLKNEILDLITKIKEIIIEEVKSFLKTFSPIFKDIIKKLGQELLKYIIKEITGGMIISDIFITIPKGTIIKNNEDEDVEFEEDNKISLDNIITNKEFKKLKKFAFKIKKLYEDKYAEVENKINLIINNMNDNIKKSCGCF